MGMTERCKANPCCGEHYGKCEVPLPQYRSGLWFHNTAEYRDNYAVDQFAKAMREKLLQKRDEGRGGWDRKDECSNEFLSQLLRDHIEKGDPVDVANFCMMLHQRGERIASTQPASTALVERLKKALEPFAEAIGDEKSDPDDEAYKSCDGCGATDPSQRCIGCLHSFFDGDWPSSLFPRQFSVGQKVTDRDGPLEAYDAGLLNDFGGGDVAWWHDYIRAELARAHDFYAEQWGTAK